MRATLLRAGTLACALLTSTALTAPALAQDSSDLPPPLRHLVDENGVDLARGTHLMNVTDIAIGPAGRGGLAYVRQLGRGLSRNLYDMGIFQGSGTTWSATLGLQSYAFSLSGTTFTSIDGSGATLTKSGTTYTLTAPDGTVVTYAYNMVASIDILRKARATSIAYPTGEQIGLAWVSTTYCSNNSDGCGTGVWRVAVRLQSVSSSLGYQLHLNYGLGSATEVAQYNLWKRLDSINAINTTIEACSPSAHTCTLTQAWPTVSYSSGNVTDPAGRTTGYTTTETTFAIRRPSSSSDNIVYTYDAEGVITSVVRDGLTWGYDHSVAGNVATMVVTDPASQTRTIVSDVAVGQPTSVTDELGRTTAYTYDSAGRVERITAPEGNYAAFAYDGRGNVTERRAVAKPESDLDDIVRTADYPDSCANPVTCNQPTSVTDASNNTTEFTYDSTHGGLTSVTAPAPTTGAVRPQTRYTYSSLTAPGGGSVHRLTAVSACRTTSSCAGGSDEVKTTIAYSQANLLPSSATAGSGDNALSATSSLGYDNVGRLTTVDGPLSGSADTVRTRYNAAGQVIGTISPDPDGAGGLRHRARRISYNDDGQMSRIETGTVDSQSDGDWAAFASLEEVQQDYDSSARPSVQRLVSGGTTYALTQTSYDAVGRVDCVAQRMNPGEFAASSLPASACDLDTQGSFGPDRISRNIYDAAGRLARVRTALNTALERDVFIRGYSPNGQVTYIMDGENNLTDYVHDGHDRLAYIFYPVTTQGADAASSTDYEQLTYDANGNVTNRRLRDETEIAFTYDALGRLISKDLPGTEPTVSYSYDLLSRLTGASVSGHSLSFGYDALGRRLTESSVLGTLTSEYDPAGRRTRLAYPGSTALTIGYAYNLAGEMTEIRENPSGANTLLASFAYDDRGRRTSLTRGNGTVTTYDYDNVSRLTQIVQNLNGTDNDLTLGFTLSPAGQIATNSRSNDGYSFTGHANGNLATAADGLNRLITIGGVGTAHDARGNLTNDAVRTFAYSAENRLRADSAGASLAYDPLGRLYFTYHLFADPPSSGAYLVSDGDRFVAELDSSTAVLRRYVFGPGIDEPIVWYEGSGLSGRRWLHADERGSVIAVSDGSGNLVGTRNRYDEYGTAQGSLTGRFGYTGQPFVPEFGLYYYRARIYNPALGRFMQADPIGYARGMNLYAYVRNDPVNLFDPSGLEPIDPQDCPRTQCGEPPVVCAGPSRNPAHECYDAAFANYLEWLLRGDYSHLLPHLLLANDLGGQSNLCPTGEYTQYSVGVGGTLALFLGVEAGTQIGVSVPDAPTLRGTQFFISGQGSGTLGIGGFIGAGLNAAISHTNGPLPIASSEPFVYWEGDIGWGSSFSVSGQASESSSSTSAGLPVPRIGVGYGLYGGVGVGYGGTLATPPALCSG